MKAYEELKFAKQREETLRLKAQEKISELQRKLAEKTPDSEEALKARMDLEDKVVKLEQTVAKLREENLALLEKLPRDGSSVVLEFPPELRRRLKLAGNPETGGLVLDHDLLFGRAGKSLSPEAQKLLADLAQALNTGELRNRYVCVDGHTDSRPVKLNRQLNPDNWVLGARRAALVLRALAAAGVDRRRLILRSFAYSRPVVPERPDSPRNRRVEIVLGSKVK